MEFIVLVLQNGPIIPFLGNQGFQAVWESLQLFLEWAERQGILVDLSLDPDRWPATAEYLSSSMAKIQHLDL